MKNLSLLLIVLLLAGCATIPNPFAPDPQIAKDKAEILKHKPNLNLERFPPGTIVQFQEDTVHAFYPVNSIILAFPDLIFERQRKEPILRAHSVRMNQFNEGQTQQEVIYRLCKPAG